MKNLILWIYFQYTELFLCFRNPSCNTVASATKHVQEQSSRCISQQDKCPIYWQHKNKFWSRVRDCTLNVWINMSWQYHTCGLTWCGQVLGGNLLSLHAQHKWLLCVFAAFEESSLQCYSKSYLFINKIPISMPYCQSFLKLD